MAVALIGVPAVAVVALDSGASCSGVGCGSGGRGVRE